ncbi:MAG TPA: ABC transporter permease subunit [Actinomycetota bacterium]
MSVEATARSARPPLWRDLRVLRVAGQVVFVAVAVVFFMTLTSNLTDSLRRQGLDISLDFLRTRAGFGISEGISYSANDSFLRAFQVGVVNTLRVAGVGIVLATVLGVVMGVARLSPNWLVRKIAQVYVETIRNTPVLVQIIFWFFGVIFALPPIQEARTLGSVGILSNRIIALAWPRLEEGAGLWAIFVVAGVVAAAVAWSRLTRLGDRTGRDHHRVRWGLGVFTIVTLSGFLISGSPVRFDTPEVVRFQVEGGLQVSAGYAALLTGLVVYTGAFITEIVRGSILAVPKGQREAAEALGLNPFQQLRFVVLPQAMRIALPPITSQYLNLTKNSSLAIAIGFPDLMGVSRTIINQSGKATEMLLIVMATYLSMSLFISLVMNTINRRVALRGEGR